MATAAAAPLVDADVFSAGVARSEAKGETREGGMLPEQVPKTNVHSPVSAQFFGLSGDPSQTLPSARPDKVLFGGLNDPQYRLEKPIPLAVTVEESTVVVSWSEIDEFGTGATLSSAIDDFGSALRELCRQLFARGANLGADLQKVKRTMEQYIQPRR